MLGRKRWRIGLAVLVLALGGLALAGYLYERNRTGNVYHPRARFLSETSPTPPPKAPKPDLFLWPLYGYNKQHTRYFPAPASLRPPFKRLWTQGGGALREFPPVISGDHIFQLIDNGVLTATNKHTGHIFWQRRLGSLSASSPAVGGTSVYVTLLASTSGAGAGRVVALNVRSGKVLWSRSLPSASESSPLLDGERLYFGSQNGTVYALQASNGQVIWTYHAGGAVKASPTLKDGILYFGDYSGHVQAVRESNGHRVWISGSEGALFGSGTFYSTPAVIYGRVFLGNTDGRVYAYDAGTGALDWAHQTGAYVYSSPAVLDAPGLGPTIYLGSYDGNFYALDAHTGAVRWEFAAGGRISGSPTIIGDIVYFADLGDHATFGLGVSTGKVLFKLNSGSFDPVVSDGHDIYLTGYSGLYALEPR
jgi:outer membrane protein assembly factor BamB